MSGTSLLFNASGPFYHAFGDDLCDGTHLTMCGRKRQKRAAGPAVFTMAFPFRRRFPISDDWPRCRGIRGPHGGFSPARVGAPSIRVDSCHSRISSGEPVARRLQPRAWTRLAPDAEASGYRVRGARPRVNPRAHHSPTRTDSRDSDEYRMLRIPFCASRVARTNVPRASNCRGVNKSRHRIRP